MKRMWGVALVAAVVLGFVFGWQAVVLVLLTALGASAGVWISDWVSGPMPWMNPRTFYPEADMHILHRIVRKGKHKGVTWQRVVARDPAYVEYVLREWDLQQDLVEALEMALEERDEGDGE